MLVISGLIISSSSSSSSPSLSVELSSNGVPSSVVRMLESSLRCGSCPCNSSGDESVSSPTINLDFSMTQIRQYSRYLGAAVV